MVIAKFNLITDITILLPLYIGGNMENEPQRKTMAGVLVLKGNSSRPDLHHRIPTAFSRQSKF